MKHLFSRYAIFLVFQFGLTGSINAAICNYEVLNEWPSGFTVSISIVNDGAEDIDGWAVSWEYSDGSTVGQLWDGVLSGSNPYTATNFNYNSLIAAGETIIFGFNGTKSGSGQSAEIPDITGDICGAAPAANDPPIAVASASSLSGIVPFDVTFNAAESSDPNNNDLTYLWDFGNGETSNEVSLTRTYSQAGEYSVSLIVNDGQINSSPKTLTISAVEDTAGTPLYTLDTSLSSLYFVSTKNIHTVETHTFGRLSGDIKDNGVASLTIDLNSVETGIATRDQRMRDFLFETSSFPNAEVAVGVNLNVINNLSVGNSLKTDISATLNLHGVLFPITSTVEITKLSNSKILVRNIIPLVINTNNHELSAGVETLKGLAGLSVISYAVPVNFTLVFNLL